MGPKRTPSNVSGKTPNKPPYAKTQDKAENKNHKSAHSVTSSNVTNIGNVGKKEVSAQLNG